VNTLEKYKIILEEFKNREELTAYDLKDILGLSPKQIDRLIQDVMHTFENIEEVPKKKRRTYKLINKSDVFNEILDKYEDIGWFFQMAQSADPDIFKDLEKITKKDRVYKIKNSPFEDLKLEKDKINFRKLKRAVQYNEYVKLSFEYSNEILDNVKALKLILVDNNWYFAYVDENDELKLARIVFIKRVDYASKNSYQKSSVSQHLEFLETNLQNSMTLFNKPKQTARLKALPNIAKYFEKDMKKFFDSQKYIKKEKGSVIFEITYTQDLEILPFIQKWLPDLVILEPLDLKNRYIEKLNKAIGNLKDYL